MRGVPPQRGALVGLGKGHGFHQVAQVVSVSSEIRRQAYEQHGVVRAELDARLGLTDEEFQVDGNLVVIGPLVEPGVVPELIAALEETGLSYFDDFVEMSGNWPGWLSVYVMSRSPGQ